MKLFKDEQSIAGNKAKTKVETSFIIPYCYAFPEKFCKTNRKNFPWKRCSESHSKCINTKLQHARKMTILR